MLNLIIVLEGEWEPLGNMKFLVSQSHVETLVATRNRHWADWLKPDNLILACDQEGFGHDAQALFNELQRLIQKDQMSDALQS